MPVTICNNTFRFGLIIAYCIHELRWQCSHKWSKMGCQSWVFSYFDISESYRAFQIQNGYEIIGKINPGTIMRFTQEWLVDLVPSGSFLLPQVPSLWNTDSSCSQGSLGMGCDFNSQFHWIKLNHHQDSPSLGYVFTVFYNSVGQFLSALI